MKGIDFGISVLFESKTTNYYVPNVKHFNLSVTQLSPLLNGHNNPYCFKLFQGVNTRYSTHKMGKILTLR